MSQPNYAPITSGLLVRKGLAAPSLLGSEEELYWESGQKILPGAAPSNPRAVVTALRREGDSLPRPAAAPRAADLFARKPEMPEEPLLTPRTVESRKIDNPVAFIPPRILETHGEHVEETMDDDDDEWVPFVAPHPIEAPKVQEPVAPVLVRTTKVHEVEEPAAPVLARAPKVREDDEPMPHPAIPRTATAAAPPMPPDGGGKPHKMMITMTPAEFERLGIAAVKKGVTRHQIIRHALDLHLDELKREYGGCGCMATGGSCSQDCGNA